MQGHVHDTWFDVLIDGANRAVRPVFTFWAFGVLIGYFEPPAKDSFDPMVWNILWTIITFWFGSRMLFKDLPNLIRQMRR